MHGNMAIVQNRVDRETVAERLAVEFHEAAQAARGGGQLDLARSLEDKVEAMRLAADLNRQRGPV